MYVCRRGSPIAGLGPPETGVEACGAPDRARPRGRSRPGTFPYDAAGRLVRASGPDLAYTHDAAGNRATLTASGHTLTFEHDALSRETSRHLANAFTLHHTLDATGGLT
ncbi:hypothetical protein [Streptomyces sp. NPDC003077]|uniref:hypothetical protein n=1 Tax=Streptomyces sp. NPDC003077 TaxID=3154443 RepID=UPI0033BC84EF